MKVDELREMTALELTKKIDLAKDELFKLRFQLAVNQLENVGRIKEARRNIARLKTILREYELGISS
ncbi:MAG: 50S ribosomal protein L29 [Peptococcaceae bacterium]